MKQVALCLGVFFTLLTFSYAQDSSSNPPISQGQTANDDNSQIQSNEATVTPSKQTDEQSSGSKTHVRFGGFTVSAGYSHFWGPGVYPYGYPYGPYYSPISTAWWDPFWGFYPAGYPVGYFSPADGKGEVKLSDAPKTASVYVNGGYAGTVEHLKSFWLDPGVYDLVLSESDGREYQQRVYVLSGKTLKIQAKLAKPITDGERM